MVAVIRRSGRQRVSVSDVLVPPVRTEAAIRSFDEVVRVTRTNGVYGESDKSPVPVDTTPHSNYITYVGNDVARFRDVFSKFGHVR